MSNEEKQLNIIIEALSIALLEIREEAYLIKNSKIYKLADLVHNLPSELREVIKSNSELKDILSRFESRVDSTNMNFWLDNIKKHYD